jgi:hypothetical protein
MLCIFLCFLLPAIENALFPLDDTEWRAFFYYNFVVIELLSHSNRLKPPFQPKAEISNLRFEPKLEANLFSQRLKTCLILQPKAEVLDPTLSFSQRLKLRL